MPILKLEVDSETYDRLVEQSVAERRSIVWHAGVVLRRALGLPFPIPGSIEPDAAPANQKGPSHGAS